ncbi:DRTGG domain-containing protein [Desulfosarcina cetonica]|uniref:DRTGG domain-containing protein n=1 Tax=Desulfosarcina cetonica TaxID=90730 RepID=UPI0006D08C0B|nr:DRTGG domain-containing protein [Desulfosarcina cetonica]
MKISEIKDILNADMLCGDDQLDTVIVAGGAADLMDDVLAAAAKGSALLTGVTTDHVIRTAKIVGVGVIVIVRGKKPPADFVNMAKSFNIPIMLTDYSLFVACGRLYMNGIRGLDGSW